MPGRHSDDARSHLRYLGVLAVVGLVAALAAWAIVTHPKKHDDASALAADSGSAGTPSASPHSSPVSSTKTSAGSSAQKQASTHTAELAAAATANAAIARLVAGHPAGSVSVATYNPATKASYFDGATSGMWTASVIKLELIEELMIKHQTAHTSMSSYEKSEAKKMIENSDNNAADYIFSTAGGTSALVNTCQQFGMTHTVVGPDGEWGLTTTTAADQMPVLKNLVSTDGPLTSASRSYILGLMSNVEADQRWGVSAGAQKKTSFVNKNGWLNIDDDHGLWVANSDGIITVNGQKVLISVMTAHSSGFKPGVSLNEAVARAAAPVVAS